jgi:hypothetical protein
MTFALQLTDEGLVNKAVQALEKAGIPADSVPVADCLAGETPQWGQADEGGWYIRIAEDRLVDGMKTLEPIMGYTPDE